MTRKAMKGDKKRMTEARDDKLYGMPSAYRPVFQRAYAKKGRKAAINAFCLDCMGYGRDDVGACEAVACPLWEYRPYQREEGEAG